MDPMYLSNAVNQYTEALAALEKAGPAPQEAQVLHLLLARDALQASLDQNRQEVPGTVPQLVSLDNRLRKLAGVINKSVDLKEWSTSLKASAESWWWNLDWPKDRLTKLNWLWGVLTAVLMTFAVSFAIDISSRLIKGSPDTVGTFALVTQGLIMALSAGGVATKFGRDFLDRILGHLAVPSRFWTVAKAGMALVLFILVTVFQLSMPRIAVLYNNEGLRREQKGQISSALAYYRRAIALYPDYPAAHYNQALLYEDIMDYDAARSEYLLALQGGLDAAYNNLARLDIKDEAYSDAVSLLLTGLDITKDDVVRYDMLKNLGWARVGQQRYSEADAYLRSAIELDSTRAPAYCLLAQVLEGENNQADAMNAWSDCLKYASSRNPDEDMWIGMARQRFEPGGGTQ
jgi:tetratricopeptide (TPR) repeat protein